jgi:hypothetical protein
MQQGRPSANQLRDAREALNRPLPALPAATSDDQALEQALKERTISMRSSLERASALTVGLAGQVGQLAVVDEVNEGGIGKCDACASSAPADHQFDLPRCAASCRRRAPSSPAR